MIKFKIMISYFITSFLIFYGSLVWGGNTMSDDIKLTLTSDKNIYSVGESIKFTYTFLNSGSKPVYILPWGGHYCTNWISAYSEGKKLQNLPLVIYELKTIPKKEEFIRLGTKESHSISIQGKIVRTTLSKFGSTNQKKYKGLFIDFDNSAMYLEKTGTFKVKAFYSGSADWKIKGKELYNLDNVFIGNLESDELKITIIK